MANSVETVHQKNEPMDITGTYDPTRSNPSAVRSQIENNTEKEDIDSASDSDSEEEEEERINPGYKEWKKRRKAWTKGQEKVIPPNSVIEKLSESERVTVYKHFMNNRKAKKPVSLADLLIIMKAGWIATGQWPPPSQ